MQLLGCKLICTTSHHPVANWLIECFHHQLKQHFKHFVSQLAGLIHSQLCCLVCKHSWGMIWNVQQQSWAMVPHWHWHWGYWVNSLMTAIPSNPTNYVTKLIMTQLHPTPVQGPQLCESIFDILYTHLYSSWCCEKTFQKPMMIHLKYFNIPVSILHQMWRFFFLLSVLNQPFRKNDSVGADSIHYHNQQLIPPDVQ